MQATPSKILSRLRLSCGIAALPRLSLTHGFRTPSEDAFFLTAGRYLTVHGGLADGVGSMRQHGLDPGAYPRELLSRYSALAQKAAKHAVGCSVPSLLQQAHAAVQAQGACTVCAFRLEFSEARPQALLTGANLGDCSLLVFRGSQRLAAVQHQRKAFDRPFQLGQLQGAGVEHFQQPAQAELLQAVLLAGDTVVLCSDGVTDNLFEEEVGQLVAEHRGGTAQQLALSLVRQAHAASLDRRRDGPFALAAKDSDVVWEAGGRIDDATVVVLQVVSSSQGEGGELLDSSEAREVLTICAEAQALLPSNSTVSRGGGAGKSHST